MISTAQEVLECLRASRPETVTNREMQRVLPHRSVGAIGGSLHRLAAEGVLEPVASADRCYVYAVRDLDAPVVFHRGHSRKARVSRNDGAHAKRKRFDDPRRAALNAIRAALAVLERELR